MPWSAVRLLRLVRAGELGGLDDAWEGWTISRHGLRSPCGRLYTVQNLRNWWLVIEQARFWRKGYDLATLPSAAQPREATGRSVSFPRGVVGQGEDRTRETCAGAIRQGHPSPAEPAFSASSAAASGTVGVAELPPRSGASPHPAASPADSLLNPCALPGEMAQWRGMAASVASGCVLPRDASLASQCHHLPALFPGPTGGKPAVSGPSTNRGQNPLTGEN